jgi:hypothetical protein
MHPVGSQSGASVAASSCICCWKAVPCALAPARRRSWAPGRCTRVQVAPQAPPDFAHRVQSCCCCSMWGGGPARVHSCAAIAPSRRLRKWCERVLFNLMGMQGVVHTFELQAMAEPLQPAASQAHSCQVAGGGKCRVGWAHTPMLEVCGLFCPCAARPVAALPGRP